MWRRSGWPKVEANRIDRKFIRDNLPRFALGVLILVVATLPTRLLLPRGVWLFSLGAVLATAIWMVVWVTAISSGSIHKRQGSWGENFTRDELKKLKKDGWTHFHGIDLQFGDIDFVAVGPGGVLVIESKWLNDAPDARWQNARRNAFLRQVRQNAETVRAFLGGHVIPVVPKIAVTLWGPASKDFATAIKSDYVFVGTELCDRVRRFPPELSDAQQATITHELRSLARGFEGANPAPG